MIEVPTCSYCGEPLHTHAQCSLCRCLIHANAQCRYDPSICRECDLALSKRGARRCTIGGEIKPLTAFAKEQGSTKHYRACRSCRGKRPKVRAAGRDYYARNQGRLRAYAREYSATHRETVRETRRRYYQATRALRLRYGTQWRTANRARHAAYSRAYDARNRDARNAAKRAAYQRQKLAVWFGGPAATG